MNTATLTSEHAGQGRHICATFPTVTDNSYAVWTSYTGLNNAGPDTGATVNDGYPGATGATLTVSTAAVSAGYWLLVFNFARSSTSANNPETWTADPHQPGAGRHQQQQVADATGRGLHGTAQASHTCTSTLSAAECYKVAISALC